ncbi:MULTISPECIES: BrxA/BrxB family bacilliredoxin [Streptacidiphilus]|uniref:BrxA/BrxB family bacilliredoxin n=1 Tax=Streptacidiphilus cavernicola TaxID=3342716 RepID=A0ABV6UP83_9ACTN|nr:BrxA/BrxB family bacilliredoxin [Streptacidiphilus jeojiense]
MPHYSPLLVKPMREELTSIGFRELLTSQEVDAAMEDVKTDLTLVAVNAVTAAAAGMARPGVRLALANSSGAKVPDRLLTVLPGDDVEAVQTFFRHLPDFPPSDPSFFLFKDGEVVYYMPQYRIEGRDHMAVAADLSAAFAEFDE